MLVAIWFLARATPHLRVGPMSIGDAGRVQVFLTLAILARLAIAFPKRSRYRSLGDFLRRQSLDRRCLLLLLIAVAGVLICLGGNTPYYRFLFQSFGSVFRAIRVAARGIVLVQAALAVLAAWGLSLLTRGRSAAARRAGIIGAIALITLEYRAFPIRLFEYDSSPVPVYEWLRSARLSGGVVEWPLGFPYDCEYTVRQAEHGKPLVNGHSSFAPKPYERLYAMVHTRPIPETIWPAMRERDARLFVYHPHGVEPIWAISYRHAVRTAHERGTVVLLGSFPHAADRDFVFQLGDSPDVAPAGLDRNRAEKELAELFRLPDSALTPPFASLEIPDSVSAEQWQGGWALDDSGIAEIRIASELGPSGLARLRMRVPGMSTAYPDYPDAADDRGGFGFPIPVLPPGPHTLTITVVAKDGGITILSRPIRVR
jgi:hypothetical protein